MDKIINESWIKLNEIYSISSRGNFKKNNKLLKGHINKKGYTKVYFNKKLISLHRLVALTFIPNPNNYPQVNHKNGIKSDNRVENLEWCNNSMNQIHAYFIGLKSRVLSTKHKNALANRNKQLCGKKIMRKIDGKTYLSERDAAKDNAISKSWFNKCLKENIKPICSEFEYI